MGRSLDTAINWTLEKSFIGLAKACWFVIGIADRVNARKG